MLCPARLKLGTVLRLTLRSALLELSMKMFAFFVADVVKSVDTVDRWVLDCVLSGLGLPGWFQHEDFQYSAGMPF